MEDEKEREEQDPPLQISLSSLRLFDATIPRKT